MNIVRLVLSNGFIPFLPVFIWNLLFTSKLPFPYNRPEFDSAAPKLVLILESILRLAVFLMPLGFSIDVSAGRGRIGLWIYLIGILVYFASWVPLMRTPHSVWSRSLMGFCAPAFTPLIWLVGIALMPHSWYFSDAYSPWQYLIPVFLFILFHLTHNALSFTRLKK